MKSTALGAENIIFISDAHEKFYYEKLQEVRYQDVYHKHQISFVNNSNAGEGLLFYGNVIIPFADRYPQDTRTYALMSTKPDEIQT